MLISDWSSDVCSSDLSAHRWGYDDPRTSRDSQAQRAAMTGYLDSGEPGRDELLFLPLGGAGEIGMNLNLYGHDGRWLMVDLGITFGDDTTPGIDVILQIGRAHV